MGKENAPYKNLIVYQKAHKLVIAIYEETKNFPKEELFGLTSQIRRASVSVVANVVEGYARRTEKEKTNFYCIARGSLTEVEYYLDLSKELSYINESKYIELINLRSDAGRLLNGFMKSIPR